MLLQVENLCSYFSLDEGILKAVDDVSFTIDEEETVALVGESGCGKTIVALSLIDLIPLPGRIVSGSIRFEGEDLRKVGKNNMRRYRGGKIGMIFQEPSVALNPVFTIGHQICEVLRLHQGLTRHDAHKESVRLLGETGFPEPEKRVKSYPFELSGGMQQRALITIAIAGEPKLLIADEPTTALDVTIQAEIVDLLRHVQKLYKMSILLITHDLGVVNEMANRVMVMYTGRVVEMASTKGLFKKQRHPYTRGLIRSIPKLGTGHKEPLKGIPGSVPDFLDLPQGCAFHPRCEYRDSDCKKAVPPLKEMTYWHMSSCLKYNKL